jgi:tRNA(Ile)-lysidine synthase
MGRFHADLSGSEMMRLPLVWTQAHARLQTTLLANQLLPQGSAILMAVSGGQDSLCLAKLLVDLQPKWDWRLGIVHCDHGWRSDSAENACHVQQWADQWQLPCWIQRATALPKTEAAARHWRHAMFAAVAQQQGYAVVATGHTATDRAETLLYNLLRGAGGAGMAALTWRRPLSGTATDVWVVRPLLEWTRTDTAAFCQVQTLPVWEDATNADLRYRRNRIRQELMPYLRSHFNPQVEQALAQTADILRAEAEYLAAQTEQLYPTIVQRATDGSGWHLDREALRVIPLALQRRLVRRLLQDVLPKQPQFEHIEKLVALALAPNRSQCDPLPGNWVAQVRGAVIWLGKGEERRGM